MLRVQQEMTIGNQPRCTTSGQVGWGNVPLVKVNSWGSDDQPESVSCLTGGGSYGLKPFDCSATYSHHQYFA